MPKFLYSVIFVLLITWAVFAYVVFYVPPLTYTSIFFFLGVLFINFSFTLSLGFYWYLKKKHPDFLKERILYRMALKRGFFVSFGVVGLLFLKAFNLLYFINLGLFFLLYLGIFYQMKSKR